jgi:hypothetical protein
MRSGGKIRAGLCIAATILLTVPASGCSSSPGHQISKTASSNTAATSLSPRSGSYQGTTNDGLPVSFTLNNNVVAGIQFSWQAVCDDGQLHQNTIEPGNAPLSGDMFSVSGVLDTGASARFAGAISGDSSTGTFARSGPSAFNTDCAESGTWKAHLITSSGVAPTTSPPVTASSAQLSLPPGRVQHHPRIFLIFWGSAWQNDSSGFPQAAQELFQHLAGSSYNQIVTQYRDAAGTIANDASLGGVWNDQTSPPGNLGAANFAAEISHAVAVNSWPVSQDTQFILYPQQGSSYADKPGCGWHDDYPSGSQTYIYAVIPFTASGCNVPGTMASMARTTSHEYFEMATDPLINAWTSSNGNEVADLCVPYPNVTGPAGVPVIEIWSQDAGKCVSGATGFQPPADFSAFDHN